MKAKINGIVVEGTPQEVAELAKLLEARVEVKQPATEKDLEDIKRRIQEQQKSNIPWWQYDPNAIKFGPTCTGPIQDYSVVRHATKVD